MILRKKRGTRVKADAKTIFDEVEAAKEDGNIDLQTIVDRAKPAAAPLHGEFTWKNGELHLHAEARDPYSIKKPV